MDKLELIWETLEFCIDTIHDVEAEHTRLLDRYKAFIAKNSNPNQFRKNRMRKDMNKSFSRLINIYQKQLNCLTDLIKIHKYYELNGIPIPEEREIGIDYLYEFKNTTATLIEQSKIVQSEINEVLS